MAHDVFVSHASRDKPIADATVGYLERAGVRCWVAPRDILPGSDWGSSLVEAIKESRGLILILSGAANESPHIRREVERAVTLGIPILPIRVEEVLPHGALEYHLGTVHWLDAITPPFEAHLARVTETVKSMLRLVETPRHPVPPVAADPVPPPPPPPPPRPREARPLLDSMPAATSSATLDLPRVSLRSMLLLSTLTLGGYNAYWFSSRRGALNALGTTSKLGEGLPAVAVTLAALNLLGLVFALAGASQLTEEEIGTIAGLVYVSMMAVGLMGLVMAFKVRTVLSEWMAAHAAVADRPSGIATFFFQSLCLQHRINRLPASPAGTRRLQGSRQRGTMGLVGGGLLLLLAVAAAVNEADSGGGSFESYDSPDSTALAPPPPPAPVQGVQGELAGDLLVRNSCSKEVQLAVRFQEPDGTWRTEYWFPIGPGSYTGLTTTANGPRIQVSGDFYYYAKSTDGTLVWTSMPDGSIPVASVRVEGTALDFRRATVDPTSPSGHDLELTCS